MSEEDKTDKIAQDHLSDPSRRSLLKGAGLMGAAAVGAAMLLPPTVLPKKIVLRPRSTRRL